MKLAKAMATVAGLTMLSRVAGFIRDILTAVILGAGPVADAFFVALKLPNFFRRVTAEGAFSVSFVPIYAQSRTAEGEEAAHSFAEQAMAMMLAVLVPFTLLAIAVMPWVIYAIAPGFDAGGERYDLAVALSRITFPYLLFMSLTALLGGILNAHDRFGPFAAAPILFNLCLIGGLLFLSPVLETAGHGLAWAVATAGVVQFLWLLYSCRKHGVMPRLRRPVLSPKIRELGRLMLPGIIGAGVVQINLFADIIIGSFLPSGSISYLYYADRLNQLPLGVVGIAVGTALLPMLSCAIASKNQSETSDLYNRSLEYCLLLALPAAVALGVIASPIIKGLFEYGAFVAADTFTTAMVLMGYALGLPAYIVGKVFTTAYFARKNTRTPVKIAVITTVCNIVLSLSLIGSLGVMGISLATGIVGWLQVLLLWMGLRRYDDARFDARFKSAALKIILASCLMGIALYTTSGEMKDWFDGTTEQKILALLALVGGGALFYGLMASILGLINLKELKTYLSKKKT